MNGPELPFVIAHRGASGVAPENTLAAIRRAHLLGARWVEVDAQLAAGGTPVVIHDHTLSRTTDGHGAVADTEVGDLGRLDAGRWFDPAFSGERVPTLAQVRDLCADLGLGLNVELKPAAKSDVATAGAAAAVLDGWSHPLMVSSFSAPALAAFHRAAPDVALGALYGPPPSPEEIATLGLPLAGIGISVRAARQDGVAALIAAGHRVLVYTVNDVEIATRLRAWGVAAVFTDHPDRLLAAFPDAA